MQDFEIIVVVDGPNPKTSAALAVIADPRLTVLVNDQPTGPGPARNRGAAAARGQWLAFLDDDDEFLPTKLERMLQVAAGRTIMLASRARVVMPEAAYIWPRELYRPGMPIDEYLFDRRTLFRGARYMPTSSYMLPRAIFERTRFGTSSHQEDTTLLLRVTKQANIPLEMLDDTLVVVHAESTPHSAGASLGPNYDWRAMLRWAHDNRPLLTRRACSGFCLIYLGSQAARRRDLRAVPILLWHAFRQGAPRPMHLAAFAGFWLVPTALRQRWRGRLQGESNLGSRSEANAGSTAALPQARS